jgi:hypothetical protein
MQSFTISGSDPDGDPLTYTWRVNGAAVGGNANGYDFSAAPGTYVVNVTVSDGSLSVSREWTVTVVASSFFLLSGAWPYAILAVIVLAALLFVWWARRRRKPEEPRPPLR